ncbi:MAG: hypothetical protein ACLS6W_11080 [Ruminococcus sp.]
MRFQDLQLTRVVVDDIVHTIVSVKLDASPSASIDSDTAPGMRTGFAKVGTPSSS